MPRAVPAHQRLQAPNAAVGHAHDGLIVNQELVLLHGPTQAGLHLQPPLGLAAHAPVENLEPIPARLLGLVHGDVRAPKHGLGRVKGPDREHDAHRGGGVDLAGLDVPGRLQGLLDAPGHGQGPLEVGQVLQQDHELVPAEPGHRVHGSDALLQGLAHGYQQFVPGLVPQGIVDGLELVQVQEEHGVLHARAAPGPFQGPVQPVHEQGPVGLPGQLVVEGVLVQHLLGPPTRGDVLEDAVHVGDGAVLVEHGPGVERDPDDGAVPAVDLGLE